MIEWYKVERNNWYIVKKKKINTLRRLNKNKQYSKSHDWRVTMWNFEDRNA